MTTKAELLTEVEALKMKVVASAARIDALERKAYVTPYRPQLSARFIGGPRDGQTMAVQDFRPEILVPMVRPTEATHYLTEYGALKFPSVMTGTYRRVKGSATDPHTYLYEWTG